MQDTRPPAWAYFGDGPIRVRNQFELDLVLANPDPFGEHTSALFEGLRWDDDADGVVAVADGAHQVVARGLLPAPTHELPRLGARVETIEIGGRPSPAGRYGVGTVTSLSWSHGSATWRVHVEFDHCTGGWQGYPIYGTDTFVWMVHVIDSDEPPFSQMSPDAIERLYHSRQSQFAAAPAPARPAPAPAPAPARQRAHPTKSAAERERSRALAHFGDGMISIWSDADLAHLLACPAHIAVREDIGFSGRLDRYDDALEGRWVADAVAQVVAAGILPAPRRELPTFATRVETIALANRQSPRYGWATGVVDWLSWRGEWRVSVRFDPRLEMRRGGRLVNFSCHPSMVRVVGGDEPPFSGMGPDEIKELFEELRQRT